MKGFENVIGYEKEKGQLYRLCDMVKSPEKYAALGVRLPRGVLLHGDPGVGKTLMATALLEAMGRKSYILRKDESNEKFVETIRKVFAEAKENAPSVILLDDLDKFPSDSDSHNPEELIAVQTGIDAVRGADVFIVATANDEDELPRALRPAPAASTSFSRCARPTAARPSKSSATTSPIKRSRPTFRQRRSRA